MMNVCTLPPPLARLLDELTADHAFGEKVVAPLRDALRATEREADNCYDALQQMQGLALIAAQPRPARDRFQDIAELINAKRRVTVTIKVAP